MLAEEDLIECDECFINGSFAPANKGSLKVGKTKQGKGTKWMVLVDGAGTPLGAHLGSASPAEVTLVEPTLANAPVRRARWPGRPRRNPDRLIADRAYDSNPLRTSLERRRIDPIIPAQSTHKRASLQDGRKLRRFRHQWIGERTFAWLGAIRQMLVRHDRLIEVYQTPHLGENKLAQLNILNEISQNLTNNPLIPWRFRRHGGPINTLIARPWRKKQLLREIEKNKDSKNDFSIIIGVKDRNDFRLSNALKSIRSQAYPQDLVFPIVVDYGSSGESVERTMKTCQDYSAKLIKVDSTAGWNRSHCLNIGIKSCVTKFIMTSDADIIFSPGYLAEAKRILTSNPLTVVLSRCMDLPPETNSFLEKVEQGQAPMDMGYLRKYCVPRSNTPSKGINATYTIFLNYLRGYDEFYCTWGYQDQDFIKRLIYLGIDVQTPQNDECYFHQWHSKHEGVVSEELESQVNSNRAYYLNNHSIVRNRSRWGEISGCVQWTSPGALDTS